MPLAKTAKIAKVRTCSYLIFLALLASWRENRFGCGRRPRWVFFVVFVPFVKELKWIPAFAGMTESLSAFIGVHLRMKTSFRL
jgi:hypothetical protein